MFDALCGIRSGWHGHDCACRTQQGSRTIVLSSVLPAEELHDERQFSAVAPAVERICADIHPPLDRARANGTTLQSPVVDRQNADMRDPLGHVWILDRRR